MKALLTTELLRQRLELIFRWYQGMVNPASSRLEHLYFPQTDTFEREQCPIRDLGSVWDIELLSGFLGRDDLHKVIETSLRHYHDCLGKRGHYLVLDPKRVGEPSSIAHSAFMLLALLHGPARDAQQIGALADGILQQQRPDGSYQVYFDDLPDQGEELYAGEAMLGLLEAYRDSADARLLESVARGLAYYEKEYFQHGRVGDDLLVFFANWQSQAARVLFECAADGALKGRTANYLCRLHDRIIEHGFYGIVKRDPDHHVSVEVACALEGLNDAYAVAQATGDQRISRFRDCICVGLRYLLDLQCINGWRKRERGGFGVTFAQRAQRIDITGHAASAFMKSVENRIGCD